MDHPTMPLMVPSRAKQTYGEPLFNEWRVAIDSYMTMTAFLDLTPEGSTFTESDRQSIKRDLARLSQCMGTPDAGQRKSSKTPDFSETPFLFTRIAAACMHMELSGALDRLDVDDPGRMCGAADLQGKGEWHGIRDRSGAARPGVRPDQGDGGRDRGEG